jgi:hypothetical protein
VHNRAAFEELTWRLGRIDNPGQQEANSRLVIYSTTGMSKKKLNMDHQVSFH